jgi:hypothetical protein
LESSERLLESIGTSGIGSIAVVLLSFVTLSFVALAFVALAVTVVRGSVTGCCRAIGQGSVSSDSGSVSSDSFPSSEMVSECVENHT